MRQSPVFFSQGLHFCAVCCPHQKIVASFILSISWPLTMNGRASLAPVTVLRLQLEVYPLGFGCRNETAAWRQHCSLELGSVRDHLGDSDGCARIRRGENWEPFGEVGEDRGGIWVWEGPTSLSWVALVVWLGGLSTGNSETTAFNRQCELGPWWCQGQTKVERGLRWTQ